MITLKRDGRSGNEKDKVTRYKLPHDRHTVSLLTDYLVFSPYPYEEVLSKLVDKLKSEFATVAVASMIIMSHAKTENISYLFAFALIVMTPFFLKKISHPQVAPEPRLKSSVKSVWSFIGKGVHGGLLGGSIGGGVGGFEYARYMRGIGEYYFSANESLMVTYFLSIALGTLVGLIVGLMIGAGIGFGLGRSAEASTVLGRFGSILIGTVLGGLVSTMGWVLAFIVLTQFQAPWLPISCILHGLTAGLVGIILILGLGGVKDANHYFAFALEAMAFGVLSYVVVSNVNTGLAILENLSEIAGPFDLVLRIIELNLLMFLVFGACVIAISSHRKKWYYGNGETLVGL